MSARTLWLVASIALAACGSTDKPATPTTGTPTTTGTGTGAGTGPGTGTTTGAAGPEPVAVDDAFDVPFGDQALLAVLANDTDPENDIDPTTLTVVSAPLYGIANVQPTGEIGYRHTTQDAGPDTFTYTIADLDGNVSNEATVTVTLLNTPPTANDDARNVSRGSATVVNVANNDTDPDDGLDLASVLIGFPPASGTVVVNANGTVEYTHDGSAGNSDSFTYTIADAAGQVSNSATVDLTVVDGPVGCSAFPGMLYAVRDSADMLITIDPATLQFTDIGPLGVPYSFGELAYDSSTDTLWMVDGRETNSLFTVDRFTGAATYVGTHGINDMFGLTYDSLNDVLYGNTGPGEIYVMDRATGAATYVGSSTVFIGSLAYDCNRDQLVMVGLDGQIEEIDRNTGAILQNLYPPNLNMNDHGSTYDPANDTFWSIGWSGTFFTHEVPLGYLQTQVQSGLASHDGITWIP